MRYIVLSDDGNTLAPNAYHRLQGACNFPESPRDQKLSLILAALEKEEFDHVGQGNYRPSEISAALVKLVENRTAQVYLAGFVAFTLVWLAFNGRKPSLNRASIITASAANEFGWVEWRSWFDPTGEVRRKAATSDPASLERIFRKYRSVAHICAADVSSIEYLAPLHLWDEAPVLLNSYVQSCVLFQRTLESVAEVKDWNLWDVKSHFPASLKDWPPLDLGDELIQWVTKGHDCAVEQGLIKP
jgi:hypothetical protein